MVTFTKEEAALVTAALKFTIQKIWKEDAADVDVSVKATAQLLEIIEKVEGVQ